MVAPICLFQKTGKDGESLLTGGKQHPKIALSLCEIWQPGGDRRPIDLPVLLEHCSQIRGVQRASQFFNFRPLWGRQSANPFPRSDVTSMNTFINCEDFAFGRLGRYGGWDCQYRRRSGHEDRSVVNAE